MESVSIALVVSVDVYEHGQTLGNVAFGGEVDGEVLGFVRDGDEGLD